MVDIRLKVVGPKLISKRFAGGNLNSLKKAMHRRLSVIWRNAGDAFIRVAIRKVLVETGMSAASFFPLSRAIRRVSSIRAIEAHISAKKKRGFRKGIPIFPAGKRSGGIVSEESGNAVGNLAFEFDLGTSSIPIFKFQFLSLVFQLAFHERRQKALESGLDAFDEVIKRDVVPSIRRTLREFLSPRGRG